MSRLSNLPYQLQESFANSSLLKVISGLNNFDQRLVTQIARSASLGGADLLDIACHPELVRAVVECSSDLPICVSSVEPKRFPDAVEAGASIIEIGNFDSFYPQGRFFDADEVIALTQESRKLLPEIVLSVTIPHYLPYDQQSKLALELVLAGADVIQTEGGTSANPSRPGSLGLIEKAAPTLAAVHSISKSFLEENMNVPLICASGLSEVTVPMAFAIGAAGVGVGSAINRLDNELEMIAMVQTLREAVDASKSRALNIINETK